MRMIYNIRGHIVCEFDTDNINELKHKSGGNFSFVT